MKIAKGDFIVAEAPKKGLFKVTEIGEDGRLAVISQSTKRNSEGKFEKKLKIDVSPKQVLTNLGKAPHAGTVYGVKIEPLYRRESTNLAGDILFYVNMKDAEVEKVKKLAIRFYKKLKEKRLRMSIPEIEIRTPQGKYAGYYKFMPRAEADVLCIKPSLDTMPAQEIEYYFAHEYAHGIWFRHMTDGNVVKWIQMYDKHMALREVDEADLNEVLEEIIAAGSFRDWKRNAEEEDQQIGRACLRHIKHVHGIDKNHLESLLRQGQSLEDYWPTFVEFSEKGVIISEYANKSPEEFFAESFAFWFVGKKLPADVQKLLDRSLSQLIRAGKVLRDEAQSTDSEEE